MPSYRSSSTVERRVGLGQAQSIYALPNSALPGNLPLKSARWARQVYNPNPNLTLTLQGPDNTSYIL